MASPKIVATNAGDHGIPALKLPTKVDSIIGLVPQDASIVVHVDPRGLVTKGLDGKTQILSQQAAATKLAEATGLPTSFTGELLGAVEEAIFFAFAPEKDSNPFDASCLGLKMQNEERFDALLEHLSARRDRNGRLESTKSEQSLYGAWIAASRIAVACTTSAQFEESLRAGRGEIASFVSSKHYHADQADGTWAAANLHQIAPGKGNAFEEGSHLFASVPKSAPTSIDLRFAGRGTLYPQLADMIVATNHVDLAKFPAGATALVGLSVERAQGKTIIDLVNELERMSGAPLNDMLRDVLHEMSIAFPEFESLVGGELALGVYSDPKFATKLEEVTQHKGLLVALRTAHEARSKNAWRLLTKRLKEKQDGQKMQFATDSVEVDLRQGNAVRFERRSGVLLAAVGEKTFIGELVAKYAGVKATFASNAEFEAAREAANPSHIMGYVDVTNLLQTVGLPMNDNPFNNSLGKTDLLTMTFGHAQRGLDIELHSSVSTVGVASALAIFGVNRYLKSAKTAQAKMTVGRISRHATESFERETMTGGHSLCKSATAVPSVVPAGRKYVPSDQSGRDFLTGDVENGWRCLRFQAEEALYYQYEYRVGGNYKGPGRGGPDPGPNGFEVSAEGDLDGDGQTSLFTLVGQVENGELRRATQVFVADEFE